MAITELKENWEEDMLDLNSAISSLKKSMNDFKDERKSEWKIVKKKFNEDKNSVNKSLKEMSTHDKK